MSENLFIKMRPLNIDEMVGQNHLVGQDGVIRKLLNKKSFPHSIFYGPPGTGKTTLAKIISKKLSLPYYELDATSLKVDEVRKIFNKHKDSLLKPLIFIDEIHRLTKTQQEVLLLPMENREFLLIGATTQNPYFSLSSGVRSRLMIFEFKHLIKDDFLKLLTAVSKMVDFKIDDEAKDFLISSSGGDARAMLNLLNSALLISSDINLKLLKSFRSRPINEGSSSKDNHYQLTSALIKSIRGSDVNASLYWLARLIEGAEPVEFIARRLVILSSEDIGNANPNALTLANSTMQAVKEIGYPEARILLAQLAIYLASSPKSNSSYKAINMALEYVEKNPNMTVPVHLSDPPHKSYLYPHDFGGFAQQKYWHGDEKLYESSKIGFEETLDRWLEKIKGKN